MRRLTRQIATRVLVLGTVVGLVAACTTGSESEVRAGAVYEGVIRWFASEQAVTDEPLVMFVEPRGEGTSIDIAVQAEVVEAAADAVEVTFIDSRDEALEADEEGTQVVRHDGMLIRVGPVLEEGRRVTLEVDVFVDEDTDRGLRFSLLAAGDTWKVIGEPAELTSG